MASEMQSTIAALAAQLNDKGAAESSLQQLKSIFTKPAAAPFAAKWLPLLLEKTADKDKLVAKATFQVVQAAAECVGPHGLAVILPSLIDSLENKKKPEEKMSALKVLAWASEEHSASMARLVERALPPVLDLVSDIKKNVREASVATATAMCQSAANEDVEPFIPLLMGAIQAPEKIGETVEKLAEKIFCQPMESPRLLCSLLS